MPFNREVVQDEEDAFDAFVYAGFESEIQRLAKKYGAAEHAKARLEAQANPTPVKAPVRRTEVEEETHVGAGKDRSKEKRIRALTLVEFLYNAKLIDMAMLMAADRFRVLHLEREGASEGVSGYGLNPGGSNPSTKADRTGHRLTGIKVNGGAWERKGRQPMSNTYDYEAAMLAMCGVIDVEGQRVHDNQLKKIMTAAIVETVDAPTQGFVARMRTKYSGEKQLPSAGATVVTEALKRLTLHLKYDGSR